MTSTRLAQPAHRVDRPLQIAVELNSLNNASRPRGPLSNYRGGALLGGPTMTETTDTRADTTRQQILRAAARQFARLPYHQVGLDDVLAEAELTKGAMYFHFRSKHALALAIIEDQATEAKAVIAALEARKFSGLE